MVDQGSAAEIMYPDLYKGLSLRAEDLMPYSSPLVSFKGKVISRRDRSYCLCRLAQRQWRQTLLQCSPYTAIVARPWLYTLGAVSSTLHQKIKYPSEGQIEEILGDQDMAWQCMVAAIRHRPETEPVTLGKKELQQLKPLVLSIDGTSDEAECEDLVKVTIGDDPEKFFKSNPNYLSEREKS